MKKLFISILIGFIAPTAIAANDPDSIGRSVKYLDFANPILLALYTPSNCPISPTITNSRCVKLNGTDAETFNVTNITEFDVAEGTRYMIDFTWHPTVTYTLRNATAARKNSSLSLFANVTVETDALNDPSLINPLTGAPYNGKLEFKLLILGDTRILEANEIASLNVRPDVASSTGLLSRRGLMQSYGMSATLARQVLTRPMKIRLGMSGTSTGVTAVITTVGGRLLSD